MPATFSSSAAVSSAEAIFLKKKLKSCHNLTSLLYVISEFSKTTPELGHVVSDGVEVHQGRGEVALTLARVQCIHDNLPVAEFTLK